MKILNILIILFTIGCFLILLGIFSKVDESNKLMIELKRNDSISFKTDSIVKTNIGIMMLQMQNNTLKIESDSQKIENNRQKIEKKLK